MSKLIARIPVLAKSAVDSATPKLNTFMRYAKVELVPPTPAEIGGVAQGFNNIMKSAQTGAWKNIAVKDAWRNVLVTTEVLCWFFIGECIGKGTFVGYQV
ncbi:ATP synthase subunit g, mitochondrial-like isoform X2 [Portunus trituberculatus]|uniref:ATP synthase subunit g, mitochondrial-like isoform X2 n=1 Tax=Portunus trituberculatus TaxID=210409 RepID=UPI001E1CC644|nr:ATP synthase subunit g, mitochondrial-like isoform X2 [Portunus trituberculatus]